MSIYKTILVLFTSAMFLFAESCTAGNSQKKEDNAEVKKSEAKNTEAGSTEAGSIELVAQTTCPVMGGDIDKKLYVDKDGKRIYMCCVGCKGEITDNFEDMVKKLEEKGEKPELL